MALHSIYMRPHRLPSQSPLLSVILPNSFHNRNISQGKALSTLPKGGNRLPMSRACQSIASSNYQGIHHVGFLCKDLSESLKFYQDILGMQLNPDRPDDKLPYKGAWLWVGEEMIHLMELPNPDPMKGRPEHGGRDRHICLSVSDITTIEQTLQQHNVQYTKSKSGRPAIFFRDIDQNTMEFVQL